MYTKESRDEQLNLFSDKLLAPFLDPVLAIIKRIPKIITVVPLTIDSGVGSA